MKHIKLFEEFVNDIYESKVKSLEPDQVTTIRVGMNYGEKDKEETKLFIKDAEKRFNLSSDKLKQSKDEKSIEYAYFNFTGKKKDLLKFLQSNHGMAMDNLEIYDGWPNLVRESNDSLTEGAAASMLSKLGKGVEHETVASMMDQDEDVSKEIMSAMKSLGCSAEDCVVIGDYHTDDWNKVLKVAKSSGVKFIEVKDDNGSAIVFSMNESLNENFSVGDLVRWSSPRNQTGLPAIYGAIAKDRGTKVDIKIVGTGSNSTQQPEKGPNQTPWKPEYAQKIQELIDQARTGEGYEKKYLRTWLP